MIVRSAFFRAWQGWLGFTAAVVYFLGQSELLATVIPGFSEVPAGLIGSLLWLLTPKLLLQLLSRFNADIREVLEMIYQVEEPFVVDGSKFTQTFGHQATPLPTAIQATVAWWRGLEKGNSTPTKANS